MEAETIGVNIKNVEVYGSHMGLGANASVLVTIANTLLEDASDTKTSKFISNVEQLFFPKFWGREKKVIFNDLISIPTSIF